MVRSHEIGTTTEGTHITKERKGETGRSIQFTVEEG